MSVPCPAGCHCVCAVSRRVSPCLCRVPAGVSREELPSSPLDARPTNKAEFDTYRAALVDKLRPLESSPSYAGFLEELVRDLCWNSESRPPIDLCWNSEPRPPIDGIAPPQRSSGRLF